MANQAFPFADLDFTKMMSEFKVPGVDFDALMATQRKNLEALQQANALAVEGFQAVAKRQAEIFKQSLEELAAAAKDMFDGAPADQKAAKQADLIKVGFEKAINNTRELAEIVAKSNRDAADVINKRVAELLEDLRSVVKK